MVAQEEAMMTSPSDKPMTIVADAEWRVDVEALEPTVTALGMEQWIVARANEDDPWWAMNLDDFEQAHDLFVDMYQRAATGSNVRACIEQAVEALLARAWSSDNKADRAAPWALESLQIAAILVPPRLAQFFAMVALAPIFAAFTGDPNDVGDAAHRWLQTAEQYLPAHASGDVPVPPRRIAIDPRNFS